MDGKTVFLSVGFSVLLLTPLSVKWQVHLKRSIGGAIVFGFIAGVITSVASSFIGGLSLIPKVALDALLVLGLTGSSVAYMFYRDPERIVPEEQQVMLSPADGTVIYVKEIQQGKVPITVKKGRYYELEELAQSDIVSDGGYLIGIGMNLLNVHVNRAPVNGHVQVAKHIRGEFLSLKRPEALVRNERFTTVINEGQFQVAVVQIASRLVRRIETYLKEGQTVEKGQRIGMIKFGSQVDLVVPALGGCRICVKPGDEVIAGVSVVVDYGR